MIFQLLKFFQKEVKIWKYLKYWRNLEWRKNVTWFQDAIPPFKNESPPIKFDQELLSTVTTTGEKSGLCLLAVPIPGSETIQAVDTGQGRQEMPFARARAKYHLAQWACTRARRAWARARGGFWARSFWRYFAWSQGKVKCLLAATKISRPATDYQILRHHDRDVFKLHYQY